MQGAALGHVFATESARPPAVQHCELGDVRGLTDSYLSSLAGQSQIDLLIGGSPCQDLTRMAGPARKGLRGAKSKLFFEFLRVLRVLQARRPGLVFVLENV